MNKLKFIGLTILIVFSFSAFAQEKSEIVMTEAELESFLEKVADARRAQLKAKNVNKSKNELAELRYQYNNQLNSRGSGNSEISNYQILREIDRLNARLDYMTGATTELSPSGRGSSSTVIVPGGGSNSSPGYIPFNQGQLYNQRQQLVPNQSNNIPYQDQTTTRSIWELERQLDSLKSVQSNLQPTETKDVKKEEAKNREIDDLKNQFHSLEQRLANAENPIERRYLLEELLAKFKNFKKQIFFANNSDQLESNDFGYIQDVTQILRQYPELSVVLEGWASPIGKVDYNKQLSMRRSESVERAFLKNGISQDRLVSSFRGVDKSTSASMARRVDMSIILK